MRYRYTKSNEKTFITILTLGFLLLSLFILKDLFATVVYAMILSYFIFPLYEFFLEKFENTSLAAIFTLLSVVLGLFIPLSFLSYFLILSLVKLLVQYQQFIQNPELLNEQIQEVLGQITNSSILNGLDLGGVFSKIVQVMIDFSSSFFSSLPKTLFYLFVLLFISYYFLIYNKEVLKGLNDYVPMSLIKQNIIIRNITKNVKILFRGYFLTGIIQTIIAILGYLIFGAPNLLIISTLTLLVSLIPYVGTPLIWIPVSVYMIFTGDQFAGIGLLIYGTLIISMIDNFLRPILMSDKDTISPPLVFIGFIGGTLVLGIGGIILGPLIIAITATLLKFLKEEYQIENKQ